jgi:hypothetical protein
VDYGLNTANIDIFMMGLRNIAIQTPIWPDPLQISGFGDEQVLLSNLTHLAANITKTSFPVVLDFNYTQEIGKLLAGHSFLVKQGFGSTSRYFVQALREDSSMTPSRLEITPPLFQKIHVPQILMFGEMCIFFVNQTAISVVHQQSGTTDSHVVLTVTPLDGLR